MIALDQPLAARIGLDWADAHHDVSLQETDSDIVERRRIHHTPEALAEWITELRVRFGNRPVGICVELSRGPLIHALLEHDFIVLFPVNPVTLKRFREAFCCVAGPLTVAAASRVAPHVAVQRCTRISGAGGAADRLSDGQPRTHSSKRYVPFPVDASFR